jgi:GntR family transcriptional repressor for pyruvate dehydrogenase complex
LETGEEGYRRGMPRRTPTSPVAASRVHPSSRGSLRIAPSGGVLRAPKTSEKVARDIVHDIVTEHLQPGDSLLSESAMLELYAVSRESLREGLRLLEVQGLISIRRGPGGGPVVGTVDPANLGRMSTLFYHLAGATYRELFEAWILSEGIVAERAARNPNAKARAEALEPYLSSPDGLHVPEELDRYVDAHAGFHAAIASLVDNRVLELTYQTMGQIVTHHMILEDDPRHLRAEIEKEHLLLAKAIVAGHPKRARQIMEEHLEAVAQRAERRMGARLDEFIDWR